MLVIVCYDVSTQTPEGRRRLRRVAKVCESTGQRVQKSVFECQVDQAKYEELQHRLLAEINPAEDNLRMYQLPGNHKPRVKEFGVFKATDFEGPLIY
jgi:CRISPR-associated protein Cas2